MPTSPFDFKIPFKTSSEIRSAFIKFFQDRGHKFVPSSGLVPWDDPTLLFTNSGMNQFKALFLGNNPQGLKRAANTQKCLRVSGKHNDLEEVGRDGTHHTFFEMLGNWSFGDYYKKEAISWAWEFLTVVLSMPKNRLFVTVYKDDDEAEKLWKQVTDIAPERILRFERENFWEMGDTGPCGPCSEIHFDLGDLATQESVFRDRNKGVNGTDGRFVEIWNLVFMQFERLKDSSLIPLKDKHVDTGAGFERICCIVQNKDTNYDSDCFRPLIDVIAKQSSVPYQDGKEGVPHRVIADHIRTLAFAVADGATPGNEGRGYVLRRILRRASRFAYELGQREPFLFRVVPTVVRLMGEAFPEVKTRQTYIEQVIEAEEKRFLRTLVTGMQRLEKLMDELKNKKQTAIPGKEVFMFHDTFGFPSDLSAMIAAENGLTLDYPGFELLMEEQRDRARKAAKFDDTFAGDEGWQILDPSKTTEFTGYQHLHEDVKVLRYREEGDVIFLVLNKTPFYAEAGGQIGDQGELANKELNLKVIDCFKVNDLHVHKCHLLRGLVTKENLQILVANVSPELRQRTAQNHSATHLLHAALRQVLGESVAQQGSYVGPDRLRFDFAFARAMTKEEVQTVENLVNGQVQKNNAVQTEQMSFATAKQSGAIALFGEKYGEVVRVLSMGDFSKEFCGGTHVQRTGDIGLLKITGESSIAAGVRRIEALTGPGALEFVSTSLHILGEAARILKSKPEELPKKVTDLTVRVKELEQRLSDMQLKELDALADTLIQQHRTKADAAYSIVTTLDPKRYPRKSLQEFLDALVPKLDHGVAVLTQSEEGELSILVGVGKRAGSRVNANDLIKLLAQVAGGRGGGRPDRARAGSKLLHHESDVLREAKQALEKALLV